MIRNLRVLAIGSAVVITTACSPIQTSFSKNSSQELQDTAGGSGSSGGFVAQAGTPASLRYMDASASNVITQLNFFGQAVNSFSDSWITVGNSGGLPATLLANGSGVNTGPFQFKDGAYPGTGGTCPPLGTGTLQPGQTCKLVVRYQPTQLGDNNGALTLNYYDGQIQQTLPLGIYGDSSDAPFLTVLDNPNGNDDPTGVSFAGVSGNAAIPKTLYVTNLGSKAAQGIVIAPLPAPFSVTGGTCGNSLPATTGSNQCTLLIAYTPGTTGTANDVLKLTYDNGSWAGTALLALSATTTAVPVPATLVITANTVSDWGLQQTNTSASKMFTVKNSGTVGATGIAPVAFGSAAWTYTGGTYPGTGGGCGTTLAAGSTCALAVSFAPTTSGASNDSIELHYAGDGGIAASAGIKGTGVVAAVLGSSGLGCDASAGYFCDQTYTIANPANSETATSVAVSAPNGGNSAQFAIHGNTCGTAPAPGSLAMTGTCSVVVRFSPTAGTVATYSSTVNVTYLDGISGTTRTLPLTVSGNGLAKAFITQSQTSLGFGNQLIATTSNPMTDVLSYYGTNHLTLTVGYTGTDTSFSAPTGCSSSISGGCTLGLTFSPTTTGAHSNNLQIKYDDGAGSAGTLALVAVSGIGTAPVGSSVSSSLAFGSEVVDGTITKSVTLTNSSGATISNMAIGVSGTGFAITTAGIATACASGSCTFNIAFTPTNVTSYSGTLSMSYTAAGNSITIPSVALSGTGTAPFSISPSSLSFGSVLNGSSATLPVTITAATGAGPQILGAPTLSGSSAGYYSISGSTCTTSASATGCTFNVVFKPTSPGGAQNNVTLSLSDSDQVSGNAMPSLSISSIAGTGGAVASVALLSSSLTSASGVYGFSPVAVNGTGTGTFVFKNSGGVAANITGFGSLPATPFSASGCAGNLNPGSTCTVTVAFAPKSASSFSSSFTLSYSDGSASQTTAAVSISGTSFNSSTVSIAAATGSNANFGSQVLGSTTTGTFLVSNVGTAAVTGLAPSSGPDVPYSYTGGSYPGTGGNIGSNPRCGTSLGQGLTCAIVLQFSPTAPGSFPDTVALGYNDGTGAKSASISLSGIGSTFMQLAVGGNHSCEITGAGQLICFGRNNRGQLGIGSTTDQGNSSANPGEIDTPLSGLTAVNFVNPGGHPHWPKQVVAGFWHTCAILEDDSVRCWGDNDQGQLGYGNTTALSAPSAQSVSLGTGRTAKSLALGYTHTCAILDNNAVKCWGNNSYGQLGLGDQNSRGDAGNEMGDSLSAVDLGPGLIPAQIVASEGDTCALFTNGSVKCWGDNFNGELGQGDATSRGGAPNQMGSSLKAIQFGSSKSAVQISAGGGFVCAVLNDGSIKCWGQNKSPDSVYAANPNGYTGSTGACWNVNDDGDLGSCWNPAYTSQTRAYGIGANQLGDDLAPVSLPPGLTAISVYAGNLHTCALLSDASVRCWGDNQAYELGPVSAGTPPGPNRGIAASDMGSNLPAISTGWSSATSGQLQLSAAGAHSCALYNDGSTNGQMKCWGTIQAPN